MSTTDKVANCLPQNRFELTCEPLCTEWASEGDERSVARRRDLGETGAASCYPLAKVLEQNLSIRLVDVWLRLLFLHHVQLSETKL